MDNSIQLHQKELCNKLWAMANALRGNMEAYEFKNYILGMIFYYYLSDKTEKYMVDPATAHFYIPEELRIRAEIRFEKKGSGFKASIVGIILLCIIFFFLLLAMPLVLDMINDFLGSFKD